MKEKRFRTLLVVSSVLGAVSLIALAANREWELPNGRGQLVVLELRTLTDDIKLLRATLAEATSRSKGFNASLGQVGGIGADQVPPLQPHEANAKLKEATAEVKASNEVKETYAEEIKVLRARVAEANKRVADLAAQRAGQQAVREPEYANCNITKCSQFGQDDWVLRQFPAGYTGNFIDIGAHDGITISNTLKLEQWGWKGVCVEPIPSHFERRQCALARVVVSDVAGNAIVFKDCTQFGTDGGDGGLSGIAGYTSHVGEVGRCRDEVFITSTMRDILRMAPFSERPHTVDFISLDVEGAELHVLKAFPFDTHCSKTWAIEHNSQSEKRAKIKELMQTVGCTIAQGPSLVDDFYSCDCHGKGKL